MNLYSLILLFLIIHWSFTMGTVIAQKTNIKIWQFCAFLMAIKLVIMSYGN